MIKFFFTILGICGLLVGLSSWAIDQSILEQLPSFYYQTIIFLALSTAIIYGYLYRVDKPDFFVQLYLLMMAIKLLAYGAYAYFMITTDKAGAPINVAFFMVLYFLFTGLEIAFLYRKINR